VEAYTQVVDRLRGRGCDAVALACTEIPMLLSADISPLPTLDSTLILAQAALREAQTSDADA
jgi:aspartate racemase